MADRTSERNYDAFWTQTPLNMARFSDSPIKVPTPDDVYYDFFPARYVAKYLEEYVDSHTYARRTLRARIVFNTEVQRVRRHPTTSLWMASTDKLPIISAPKPMICTGLTSVPNMPSLPGQKDFKGEIMHHQDFGSSSILADPKVKHITVLGGAKSPADIAYVATIARKRVS